MATQDNDLRADAKANRDRILGSARDAFAKAPGASMNSIAKAAGVGPGTLYRHFPTREALVLGVYRHEIERLVALAPELLDRNPPLMAFRMWCERLAHYGRIKHGIADALHSAMTAKDFQDTYLPMVEALEQLLRACEASGDFGKGSNAEDVLLLLGFLWRIKPGAEGEQTAERLLDLVIRGLRNAKSP